MKVSYFIAKLSLILSVLFLAACSTGKIVKTYEGDALLVEQLAVLTAPENIVVLSINGNRVKSYLLSDINVRYGLKPGKNLVVFQYESVWAKAVREDKDAPRSETIMSEPKEVLVNAKAGEQLNFRFKNIDNVRDAKVLAAAFEAELVDANLNVVVQSVDAGSHEASNAEAAAIEQKLVQENTKTSPEASSLQTLDALKVLWVTATADEKKTFLSWAFQK
ncbi:MAG: hypothetical protein ACI9T9_000920 [Oleiphilaceae bacterium]|jgi:uncharacterized protein YccT (UPF0319 family)